LWDFESKGVKMGKFCLVTPTHKAKITEVEHLMLRHSLNLHRNVDHFFCVPDNIDVSYLSQNFPESIILKMSSENFESLQSYNRLLLDSGFYRMFQGFTYLAILQLDSVLLKKIDSVIDMNFDYVGAPWRKNIRVSIFNHRMHGNNKRLMWLPYRNVQVGNGGLSIRRTESMIDLTEKIIATSFARDALSGYQNEDFVISYMCRKLNLKVPNPLLAESIFIEEYLSAKSRQIEPYGYHALEKFDSEKYADLARKLSLV
jgi:hypothetical protein